MTIKSRRSVNINLTDKEKFAVGLVREFLEELIKFIEKDEEYSMEEFLSNHYDGSVIELLDDLETHVDTLEEELNNYLND